MANDDKALRCTACACEDLERGKLYSTGSPGMGMAFRPDGAERLSNIRDTCPVYTYMCMDCGLIQMYGVRKLVAEILGRFTG